MRLPGLRVLVIVLMVLVAAPAWAHGPGIRAARIDQLEATPTPAASTWPAEIAPVAAATELATVKPLSAPSPPGAVEMIAVLIVALGLAGFGWSWQRDRRSALAIATAGLLFGFVVETTPHLVHHSLDADQGASCEVLQTAERNQAAVVALDAAPASAAAYLDDRPPPVPAPTLSAPAPCGRAPPA